MNPEAVTIQDCLEMQQRKGMATILAVGHVRGFENEIGLDKKSAQIRSIPVEVGASAGRGTNE